MLKVARLLLKMADWISRRWRKRRRARSQRKEMTISPPRSRRLPSRARRRAKPQLLLQRRRSLMMVIWRREPESGNTTRRSRSHTNSSSPDSSPSSHKRTQITPPQCLREGNKKTIFANIAEICKRMKRTDEHVTSYLFAELGTSGSVDGSRRLVIKGRFQQKQIENVLRRYIMEYVTCKTCRSPDTELNKGENRLYFITCNSCGSRRSVTAIKTGFSAQVGKRRRQQG